MPYRHTQRSRWIVIPCLAFAALDAVIAWRSGQWALVFAVAVLIAVAIVFSPLTAAVNAGEPGERSASIVILDHERGELVERL